MIPDIYLILSVRTCLYPLGSLGYRLGRTLEEKQKVSKLSPASTAKAAPWTENTGKDQEKRCSNMFFHDFGSFEFRILTSKRRRLGRLRCTSARA